MKIKISFILLLIFSAFVQLHAQSNVSERREWTSIYKNKIFTNADSATLAYRNIIEKKKIFDKTYDNELKQLSSTFVKSTFETTYEFENRKSIAISNKKNEFNKLLAGLYDQLKDFDNAIYVAKGNRFKVSILEKDYNADLSEWKLKIMDQVTNTSSNLSLYIQPKAAQKLWLYKDQIVVRQVADFANPALLMIELDYPEKPSSNLLVYFLNIIKTVNNNYGNNYKKPEPPKVQYAKFTPPKIEKFEEVKIIDQEGVKVDEVAAPIELSTGPTGPPDYETDKVFTSVQVPSTFPGGTDAWAKYLSRTLNRDLPVENKAPAGNYRVTVSFVVARDGSISDVKAENDPGYGTAAEAVRVLQKGPKWTPAEVDGHKVIYRHRQVIVFQVTED
jgi:hypothetical protein